MGLPGLRGVSEDGDGGDNRIERVGPTPSAGSSLALA
jgi:hypothetical protein